MLKLVILLHIIDLLLKVNTVWNYGTERMQFAVIGTYNTCS